MQALEIQSGTERSAFLEEQCPDDPALRSRVERLLVIHAAEDGPIDPLRYGRLHAEQDQLTQELFEESRFLSELGQSIRLLDRDYELIEEIGRGAAGVVFRARQISLNREVAVKVIHGSALASDIERERFRVEVEAAAGLNHPNIMPLYEIGRHGSYDYFSMPLMSGGTLSALIKNRTLSLRGAVTLMVTVCRTVSAAHQGGVIHRDLKPDNILLDQDGEPHIGDFGLAYRLEQHPALTLTGGIMGTPQYMAPEQADTRIAPITTATDVYGLGAILYQMLTGNQPFRDESLLRVLELVKTQPPPSPRSINASIDRDLETIVLKCLEKRPSARYSSAALLAEDLEAWLENRPITARPVSAPSRVWKWAHRRPAHAMLALLSVIFVLTLGIGGPLLALQQARYRQAAEQSQAVAEQAQVNAEQERLIAEQQKETADRVAFENRALAYSYSTRLTAAVANTDRASLASHGILRNLMPSPEQSDIRGWEWYYLFAEVYLGQRTLKGNGKPITALSFSPSGRLLALSEEGKDGTRLRDGLHAATVRDLEDPGATHLAYLWREDENQLITRSDQGVVKVWGTNSGEILAEIQTSHAVVDLAGWNRDGHLVGLTDDNAIRIWDLSNLSSITELSRTPLPLPGIQQVLISPDGSYLSGSSHQADVYLWRMDGLKNQPVVFDGHIGMITGMDWHRDSRWLATRCERDVVRVWEVPNGTRLLNISDLDERITALCWDPNGLQMMLSGEEGYLWHQNMVTGKLFGRKISDTAITSLSWCGVTHTYAIGFADGSIEMNRFGLPKSKRRLNHRPGQWTSIHWSEDGSVLAGTLVDGVLTYVDVETGDRLEAAPETTILSVMPEGWQPPVSSPEVVTSAWHEASNRIVTGNADGTVSVWDAENDERFAHFQTPSSTAPLVAWHPSGSRVASTGDDFAVHLWDWELGESVLSLQAGTRPATELVWSPEGMRLAAAIRGGAIWMWDATAGYLMNRQIDEGQDLP
ncbi:MAG: WD40 repeat domain-containing serine/threonine protein kinase [Planctomycetota bacterium]